MFTTFNSCPTGGEVFWTLSANVVIDTLKSPQYQTIGSGLAMVESADQVLPLGVTNQGPLNYVAVDVNGSPHGGANCSTVGNNGVMRMMFHAPVQGWSVTGP